MKSELIKINKLLIGKFGLPKRNKTKPDPVDTLIATILSQNTNDKNSYAAYLNLKQKFKSWDEAAEADNKSIEHLIRVGGLAKQKAKAIKMLLSKLKKQQGIISLNYLDESINDEIVNELVKFKGVGVKTASCVLLFSMNRNVCPVDTHVHRILNRIGLAKTKSPDKTFELLNKKVPDGVAHSLHTNLIMLGREICKSGKPACFGCPILKICKYQEKNLLPIKIKEGKSFLLLDSI